jgi:deferrochelatase/peroxidase EfeB
VSHQPHDTQGNILRGYRHLAHVEYRFFEIDDRDAVRALLARTASHVSTDEHWGDPSQIDVRLNVAFTYRGLEKLGRHAHFASADYEDFRVGMAARAGDQLGDSGASDPQRWEPPLREGADVLFTIYRRDSDAGQAAAGALRAQLDHAGLRELYVQQAEQLPGRREQFGFADGFSQPVVQSSPGARRRDPRGEGVL